MFLATIFYLIILFFLIGFIMETSAGSGTRHGTNGDTSLIPQYKLKQFKIFNTHTY